MYRLRGAVRFKYRCRSIAVQDVTGQAAKGGSVHGDPLASGTPRSLAGPENQQVDRGRAEMQHQDHHKLHDYGGPQQRTSRVYSDETRLTEGAARPGLSDPQPAAWAMTGGHQDSPIKGQVGRYAAVQGSSRERRTAAAGRSGSGSSCSPSMHRLAGVPPVLQKTLWGGNRRIIAPLWCGRP